MKYDSRLLLVYSSRKMCTERDSFRTSEYIIQGTRVKRFILREITRPTGEIALKVIRSRSIYSIKFNRREISLYAALASASNGYRSIMIPDVTYCSDLISSLKHNNKVACISDTINSVLFDYTACACFHFALNTCVHRRFCYAILL